MTPETIVNLCRKLVMRGNYAGAVRSLQCIEGLNPSDYDSILSGRTTIRPDWGGLVPDDSGAEAEIKAAFQDIFIAMGQHYAPVLAVYPNSSYNYDTEGTIRAVVRCSGAGVSEIVSEQIRKSRSVEIAASYAMEDDTLLVRGSGVIFLCTKAPALPPFLANGTGGRSTVEQILSDALERLPMKGTPEPRCEAPEVEVKARYAKTEDQIRDEVRARVGPEDGPGWISLRAGESALWRVPLAPFRAWAQVQDQRAKAWEGGTIPSMGESSDWKPVSPKGLRLSCDIPEHSDWLLASRRLDLKTGQWRDGALDDYKDEDLLRAAVSRQGAAKSGEEGYAVLAAGRAATGTTLVDPPEDLEVCPPGTILVLEIAGASRLQLAMTAEAVLVEVGGALAHLVSELRDANIPVLRVPGARTKFPTGTKLDVDPATGLVQEV